MESVGIVGYCISGFWFHGERESESAWICQSVVLVTGGDASRLAPGVLPDDERDAAAGGRGAEGRGGQREPCERVSATTAQLHTMSVNMNIFIRMNA